MELGSELELGLEVRVRVRVEAEDWDRAHTSAAFKERCVNLCT